MEKQKVPYGQMDHIRILSDPCSSVDELVKTLSTTYTFDEITLPLAVAAVSLKATSLALSSLNQGQVFNHEQHHEMMWEYLTVYLGQPGPMSLVMFERLLDVRSEKAFSKVLPLPIFQHLQAKATELLTLPAVGISTEQRDHWRKISEGNMPFGYTLEPQPQPGVH